MSGRAYKIIFTLLVFCALIILGLQSFWIRSFYLQKQDDFNTMVYSVLGNVAGKLNTRSKLYSIKESITSGKKPLRSKQVRVMVSSNSLPGGSTINTHIEKHLDLVGGPKKTLVVNDTVIEVASSSRLVTVSRQVTNAEVKPRELDKFMDRMLAEIEMLDASPLEHLKADTLKNIIKKELEAKGVFLPFEFMLKNVSGPPGKSIAQSAGFKENEPVYKYDLSLENVFRSNNYLWLQFAGKNAFVFAAMKGMILLSALFSLLIMAVFYYTMRLILKQKKLSDMKNDFVNNMTHELKTPIATISLATDAINNPLVKNNDEKFRDYTRILKEENQKLNSHVERVLQMAMLDKGGLRPGKKVVDLAAIVGNSLKAHRLGISNLAATVTLSGPDTLLVAGDEEQLQAVFNNLLDNALKYSSGPCHIEISLQRAGTTAEVRFKDNGIGIVAENHGKVFEKFFRVQGGNLHDVKGFGLGLSYVKSVIEAHGGTIELKSQPGKGSEFIIRLLAHD